MESTAPSETVSPPNVPNDATRYAVVKILGEGGMGVVQLAFDRRIGREVALKTLRVERACEAELNGRFVREACVQGQLEHPAIVPVYDLDVDPSHAPYFTMKRVHGETFEEIIAKLKARDADAAQTYGRRKLLSAFASACQAVAFAHARGVVHRDLKPSNVMLGGFGEVYVLDWGIAKVTGARDDVGYSVSPPVETSARTMTGAAMGTLGYMSPEQMRGDTDVDARTDVYALGAILFELLCFERLHRGENVATIAASTQSRVDGRPSTVNADVPPELDAICVRAVALDRDERFASVRNMVEAIERYLDGDRDMARRRELADEHAKLAQAAARRIVGYDDPGDRRLALQEAGRALALDPHNAIAAEALVHLLTQPPKEMPAEALAELAAGSRATQRDTARGAVVGYLAWFAFIPFGFWMGVRSVRFAIVSGVVWALAALTTRFALRRAPSLYGWRAIAMITTAAAASVTCAVCGPYVLVPTVAVINVILWLLVSPKAWRAVILGLGVLSILVPATLDWTNVVRFYNFRDGHVTILQGMLDFHPIATHALLLAASLGLVAVAAVLITRFRDTLDAAEHRLHVQAWQLKQLVPHASDVTQAR